jgi:hypothetical protein
MEDLTLIVKATLEIYAECAKNASKGFVKNWIVPLASLGLILIFTLTAGMVGGLGMAGGFILGIILALFTAQYYSWLSGTVDKDKITYRDLVEFDAAMFFRVIGISFILFLVQFLTSPVAANPESMPLMIIIYFFIVFAFNALPEVVYIQRYDSTLAYTEALKFTKENWIEWYLPYLVLLLPFMLLVAYPAQLLIRFALVSPLFPGIIILETWTAVLIRYPYLGLLCGFMLSHWFMLFRGFLFKELSSGSRRRRVYRAKQK